MEHKTALAYIAIRETAVPTGLRSQALRKLSTSSIPAIAERIVIGIMAHQRAKAFIEQRAQTKGEVTAATSILFKPPPKRKVKEAQRPRIPSYPNFLAAAPLKLERI